MSTKVTPVPAAVDTGLPPRTAPLPPPVIGGRELPSKSQPDLRLIIEEDEATGSYVYRTVDRRTGEVVQQFPVEEVLKLKQGGPYEAGTVIKTRA